MFNKHSQLDVKPQNQSQDEMMNRLRIFQMKNQKRERARMLDYRDGRQAVLKSKHIGNRGKWELLKRKMVSLLDDINPFIDFCIARYIVWRKTRVYGKRGAQ